MHVSYPTMSRYRLLFMCYFLHCLIAGARTATPQPTIAKYVDDTLMKNRVDLFESLKASHSIDLSLTEDVQMKLGTIGGTVASSFRALNQSFVWTDSSLSLITFKPNFTVELQNVQQISPPSEVLFIESVEWKNWLFLLLAYKSGMLELLRVSQEIVYKELSFACCDEPSTCVPGAAEFFAQDNKLFLVLITSSPGAKPLIIYEWKMTDLDRLDSIDKQLGDELVSPTSLAVFPTVDGTVIVVGRNSTKLVKGGLSVYVMRHKKLELRQVKDAEGIIGLLPFYYQTTPYLLALTEAPPSLLFSWRGNIRGSEQLSAEIPVPDIYNVKINSVGYVNDIPFILIPEKEYVRFYTPSGYSLSLTATMSFPGEVRSATIHMYDDTIFLVAIVKENDVFAPYVLKLHIAFPAKTEHLVVPSDELVDCLQDLASTLKRRADVLEKLQATSKQLLLRDQSLRFSGKLIVNAPNKVYLRKGVQSNSVQVNPRDYNLTATPSQLRDDILSAKETAKGLKESLRIYVKKQYPMIWESEHKGPLKLANLKASNAYLDASVVTTLNNRPFVPQSILRYSKNQTFTGKVTAHDVQIGSVQVNTISGNKVDDLLLSSGVQQSVNIKEVPKVTAGTLVVTSGRINDVPLAKVVRSSLASSTRIRGKKEFPAIIARNLSIAYYNSVHLENWWNGLRPKNANLLKRQMHVKSDLIVKNLVVDKVNDIDLKKFLSSLFLLGDQQKIRGTLRFSTKPAFTNVFTQNINGIPSSNFLTVNTDQNVNATVYFGALSAAEIHTNTVNKLDLATDVARLNSPSPFNGYVAFQNALNAEDLRLPLNTQVKGRPIAPHILEERRQVYKKPVRISGSLNVYNLGLQKNKFIVGGKLLSINDLLELYWTKSTSQNIPIHVSATAPLVAKDLNVTTINGQAVGDLLHCDTLKALPGSWWIPSAVVVGDVEHLPGSYKSTINPLDLYRSVVLTSGNFTVQGQKVFTGGVTVRHLRTNYLDQIDPRNVLLKRSPIIPGSNSWDKIWVKKDLIIHADLTPSKVNKFDLCALISKAVRTDENAHIKSMLMNTVEAKDIKLRVLNGVPLRTRLARSAPLQYLKKLVVKGLVSVPDLRYVTRVNDINFWQFIPFVVNKTAGAVIEGNKVFAAQVTVEQELRTTTVNNVNLNDFVANLLSRTRPQNVSAVYTLKSAEARWLLTWDVNNVEVGKLVTKSSLSQQKIHGKVRFLEGLSVGDLTAQNLLRKCDIKKVTSALTRGTRSNWELVEVTGNVTWAVGKPLTGLDGRGLGYLMDSAVTTQGPHTLVGEVVFAAPVEVVDIETVKDINDVALNFIQRDSLMKNSLNDQVIYGPIVFLEPIKAASLVVSGNIDVASVNHISITETNNTIIRKSRSDGPVSGKKVFLGGISASTVINNGFVNDMVTSVIATYEAPRLPPVEFNTTLRITGNLTFVSLNDINVTDLLDTRVTLNTPQTINGAIVFGNDLHIKDRVSVANINNVDVASVVTVDNPNVQIIYGPKTLTQDLTVYNLLDLGYVNNMNFSRSVREALLKDVETSITGSTTFAAPITVDANVIVDGTVNGMTLDDLQHRLKNPTVTLPKLQPLLRNVRIAKEIINLRKKPEEVLYLDSVENLEIRVSNMTHAVAHKYSDEVVLDVYGSDDRQCGLPEDCRCPVQMSQKLRESGGKLVADDWDKVTNRAFTFDVWDTTIKVITTTVSRSTKCRVSPQERYSEYTKVTWMRQYRDPGPKPVWIADSDSFQGYVSDVAHFQHGNLTYVVIGLAYDAVADTTNLNSKVILLDYNRHQISLVQEIPTYGVSSLNAFDYDSTHLLVVGNSFDSQRYSPEVPLFIYRYNAKSYKLDLMKAIPTVGVVAVASLVEGGDSIIVVAQAQTNAPVLIFKYDHIHGSYRVIQQITNIAIPTGLGAFTVGDGFVGLATADDKFRLYKFCHVEGLKLVQEYSKTGVRGFVPFTFSRHYLFLTSSQESSLLELVVQGV